MVIDVGGTVDVVGPSDDFVGLTILPWLRGILHLTDFLMVTQSAIVMVHNCEDR